MHSMNIVVYVSDWQVHGPVLIVSGSNWDCSFITAEDDGDDQSAMCIWIFCNQIL